MSEEKNNETAEVEVAEEAMEEKEAPEAEAMAEDGEGAVEDQPVQTDDVEKEAVAEETAETDEEEDASADGEADQRAGARPAPTAEVEDPVAVEEGTKDQSGDADGAETPPTPTAEGEEPVTEATAIEDQPEPADDAETPPTPGGAQGPSPTPADEASVTEDTPVEAKTPEADSQAKGGKEKPQKAAKPEVPLKPEIAALDKARKQRKPVTGKVIGWNKGGFHVVIDEVPAFCPRSAIAVGEPEEPESYLNRELDFVVLEIRKGGKRIVVSRAGAIRAERSAQRKQVLSEIKAGAVLTGTVASLTDFGAFIDLGGVQGLLHVSEISRSRVEHPSQALEEGQEVEVKVLKVEKGGKRISLSRKALEPDPWQAIGDFEEGQEIEGKVERAEKFGVLVEIAPGLSGLIPSSALSLPADASPKRVFPTGKEMKVQIVSIDKKRKRISLLPEGAQVDGSKRDLDEYRKQQGEQKLGALAAAFERAKGKRG